ncbi:hypothetical protein [Legionella israelensis]|uniref:hypothetical protein n=1 Tax=Legionella israelensis TaxID=454 RepID=UPI0026C61438
MANGTGLKIAYQVNQGILVGEEQITAFYRRYNVDGSEWCKMEVITQRYGKWSTVHKRFMRWSKKGIWQMIFNTLAVDADTEWLMIDSTIICAHQHAAGAKGGKKNRR